jgi:hypothetical protein
MVEQQTTTAASPHVIDLWPEDPSAEVRDLILQSGGVRDPLDHLARSTVRVVRDQTVDQVRKLLTISLAEVVKAALKDVEALALAARATAREPDSVQIVQLADLPLTADFRPVLDFLLDGKLIASVTLEVGVDVTVHAATATVRDARLITGEIAAWEAGATIGYHDHKITVPAKEIPPVAELDLGDGLPLLPRKRDDDAPAP